jgi:hypothetical protein
VTCCCLLVASAPGAAEWQLCPPQRPGPAQVGCLAGCQRLQEQGGLGHTHGGHQGEACTGQAAGGQAAAASSSCLFVVKVIAAGAVSCWCVATLAQRNPAAECTAALVSDNICCKPHLTVSSNHPPHCAARPVQCRPLRPLLSRLTLRRWCLRCMRWGASTGSCLGSLLTSSR